MSKKYLTNLYPGSDIKWEPASEIKAIFKKDEERSNKRILGYLICRSWFIRKNIL